MIPTILVDVWLISTIRLYSKVRGWNSPRVFRPARFFLPPPTSYDTPLSASSTSNPFYLFRKKRAHRTFFGTKIDGHSWYKMKRCYSMMKPTINLSWFDKRILKETRWNLYFPLPQTQNCLNSTFKPACQWFLESNKAPSIEISRKLYLLQM